MTVLRAGYTGTAWQVEQSIDGLRPEVIATLPSAKSARAFIDAREGRLSPARSEQQENPDATGAGRIRTAAHFGPVTAGSSLFASGPSGPALGRDRAGSVVERR